MSDSLVARLSPSDYEQVAQLVLPAPIFGWIASGADDGQSLIDNVAAFRRWRLNARVLVDVRNVDVSTTVAVRSSTSRSMIAPMGVQKAAHPEGELGMAAGVSATGSLFIQAVNATTSMEDVHAAYPGLKWWLQLYNWDDRAALERIIRRAEASRLLRHRAAREHDRRRLAHAAARRVPAARRAVARLLGVLVGPGLRPDRGIHRVAGQAARRCR